MVDIIDVYMSIDISTGTVIKNSEILKFFPDHLKIKTMCTHAVEELPYLLRYVPDGFKTQQRCEKTILENGGALMSIPDHYKNQEICNEAVDITLMH